MKKKRKIFKMTIIIIFVFALLFIFFYSFLQNEKINFGLEKNQFKELVELKEYKIFTSFDKISYKTKFNFILPLSVSFKLHLVSIDEFIEHMVVKDVFNDGGTTIYYYDMRDGFSNTHFYMCKCNSYKNNRNVYIFENMDIDSISNICSL